MYYADLTPYVYSPIYTEFHHQQLIEAFGSDPKRLRFLNVGWLERALAFETGPVVLAEVDKIATLCIAPFNLMRGFHHCDLCRPEMTVYTDNSGRTREYALMRQQTYKSRVIPLGSGEVWIKGASDDTVYVAPTMILHYIMEHGYRMPEAARNALAEMPPPEWKD